MNWALSLEAIEDAFAYGPKILTAIESLYASFTAPLTTSQKVAVATDVLAASSSAVATSLATQPASATHLDSVLNSISAATDAASLQAAKDAAVLASQQASAGS